MYNITVCVKSLDGFSHMSDITWIMLYKNITLYTMQKWPLGGKNRSAWPFESYSRQKKIISWTDAVSKEWLLLTVILHNNAIIVSRLDIGYGEQRVVKKMTADFLEWGTGTMMYHFLRIVMRERIIGGKWRGHNSLLVIIHVNFSLCIKDAQLILILLFL